jgi:serine/threonine protein kinase
MYQHPFPALGDIIGHVWKLKKKIGVGTFGDIFMASSIKENLDVAIKFEKLNVPKEVLYLEANALHLLKGSPHFPRFHYFGQYYQYKFLIMELLGPSLLYFFLWLL